MCASNFSSPIQKIKKKNKKKKGWVDGWMDIFQILKTDSSCGNLQLKQPTWLAHNRTTSSQTQTQTVCQPIFSLARHQE